VPSAADQRFGYPTVAAAPIPRTASRATRAAGNHDRLPANGRSPSIDANRDAPMTGHDATWLRQSGDAFNGEHHAGHRR
jgi:hypothetical protein